MADASLFQVLHTNAAQALGNNANPDYEGQSCLQRLIANKRKMLHFMITLSCVIGFIVMLCIVASRGREVSEQEILMLREQWKNQSRVIQSFEQEIGK